MGEDSAMPYFLSMTVFLLSRPLHLSPWGLVSDWNCSHASPTDSTRTLSCGIGPGPHSVGTCSTKHPLHKTGVWYRIWTQTCGSPKISSLRWLSQRAVAWLQAKSPLLSKLDPISPLILQTFQWVSTACEGAPEAILRDLHLFANYCLLLDLRFIDLQRTLQTQAILINSVQPWPDTWERK